jgi:murein DD-endopeptidase MepM/ murein hydrolase activator NlpD
MALPIVAGGDPDASQQYNTAIKNALAALEARTQPNYFSIAGALLNPGRTGNVGEALGSASTILGQQQAQDEAKAPGIAMMKAQLAGQQYEVANKAKALGMVSNLLGPSIGTSDPQEVQSKIASGDVPASAFSKLTPEAMTMIGTLDKNLGDTIFKAGTAAVEREKIRQQELDRQFKLEHDVPLREREVATGEQRVGMDLGKVLIEQGPKALDILRSVMPTAQQPTTAGAAQQPEAQRQVLPTVDMPVANARISSPFGQRPNPFDTSKQEFHSGIDFAAPEGSPVNAVLPGVVKSVGPMGGYGNRVEIQHKDGSTSYYAHLKDATVRLGDLVNQGQPIGTVGTTGMTTGPHVEFGLQHNGQALDPQQYMTFGAVKPAVAPAAAAPAAAAPAAGKEQFPSLKAETETESKRIESGDKPWIAKRDEIYNNYDPKVLSDSNSNLKQIHQIATDYPHIFGILQKQGLLYAVAEMAKSGASLSAGQLNARIGFEVDKVAQKLKLNTEDQQRLADVSRLFGQEFLSNVKSNRGLLGVNPTDNDARLLAAPMASPQDQAKSVQLWARQQRLLNKQKEDIYNALMEHDEQVGTSANPRLFFGKKSKYNSILEHHSDLRSELFNQFYPKKEQ